jgi:hypothetical protein
MLIVRSTLPARAARLRARVYTVIVHTQSSLCTHSLRIRILLRIISKSRGHNTCQTNFVEYCLTVNPELC